MLSQKFINHLKGFTPDFQEFIVNKLESIFGDEDVGILNFNSTVKLKDELKQIHEITCESEKGNHEFMRTFIYYFNNDTLKVNVVHKD